MYKHNDALKTEASLHFLPYFHFLMLSTWVKRSIQQ